MATLRVAARPKVALFSTGDELVMPGTVAPEDMPSGAIYNSNRFFLRALLQRMGCVVTDLGIVPEAFAFMGNAAAILSARIAYVLNLKGPCLAIDTACSSSLSAIHLACRSLLDGECDMALAGAPNYRNAYHFHGLESLNVSF